MFKFLKTTIIDDFILHIELSRAPANGVNGSMYEEIQAIFSSPDTVVPNVQAVILSGEGKHFCAGNDLDEFTTMTPENGRERMWKVREAFFAIQDCPVPVIGAVHGAVLGTGLAIAASCDFIVAAPDARFGLPELTVGVFGGARHLARIAPEPLVRRMFFTGEHMPARDFASAGGCIFICEGDSPISDALKYARAISSYSPTALRLAKHVLNQVENMDLKEGYQFEQGFTVKASGHPDSKEALAAFREKRRAAFLARSAEWTVTL